MKILSGIRKNIGTIIASFGFLALCIITFGDLADIATEEYWQNVLSGMTSIGFMTIALTMIQVAIKQGIAEQALQRGLNTETTTQKWKEHRDAIKNSQERIIFMPYFLQVYNDRQTRLKKREFLVDNNYSSESALLKTGNKRHIRKYHSIRVFLTVARIKWATTEIVYNKHGQIQTLQEYRSARLGKGIMLAFIFMIGVTFLTTGLFMSTTPTPLWQKFVKLGTYVLTLSMSSVFAIVKAYEKGAFGVPNELEELNAIWQEFAEWKTPDWVIKEVEEFNQAEEVKNAQDNQTKKEITLEQRYKINHKKAMWLKRLTPVVLYIFLTLSVLFLILAFRQSLSNLSEINTLTDKDQIMQQVQEKYPSKKVTDKMLTEQAQENYDYLKGKYREWEIYGNDSSMVEIKIIDYRNALFGNIIKVYLILTLVFLAAAIILGKIVFPQLAKMCTSANDQMADLAAIQTSEIVKEKKNKGEWF